MARSDIGDSAREAGRLAARPRFGESFAEAPRGGQELRLDSSRDGLVYVPPTYRPGRPSPLLLMLHGAGGEAQKILRPVLAPAEAHGVVVLAPESRGRTWDVILGDYGPDVAFIDRALDQTFARYEIDPARIAVGGFSDGASYALSLGVINGDLFTHVLAFSPGFMAPTGQADSPRIFMSHGIADQVLPIEVCSRRLAPALRGAGYDLRYVEFDGGHAMPREIVEAAFGWFLEQGRE